MNIFYAPDILAGYYQLNEDESKHSVKVLRLKVEDKVLLIDGKGTLYTAKIIDDHPKRCTLQIIEQIDDYQKRPFRLHIAIAPTKNIERLEWFVEKAVEIGVDEITPLICNRSERKNVNIERLERIAISALKQSVKAYLPKINKETAFKTFVNERNEANKYIAYCNDDNRFLLKDKYLKGSDALILIGPEGDFTPEEVQMAIHLNFVPITLGVSRLRTETAGIVACNLIDSFNC